ENAEAVFVGAPTVEQLASTVAKVRDALEAAGRDRYAARVYTLLTVITDATDELAQAKYEDYLSYASELGALVLNSGWM
ncbi:LLM class flavin-dependent oxidoreductase, partial [Bacillus sp. S34]|nr:LLM class flavin-dependent oxidoreductase [Bacillus sp. S34]